ncbi:putative ephrin-receptor like protein [Spironucleus salmonicida]|nr:putative ephrin-receptor like protein [Spironucleus salmonicida]
MLQEFEQETNTSSIILIGAYSNEFPSFSIDPDIFKKVFQKLVVDAKKANIRSKFAFGISASACDGPNGTYQQCDGWYVDEEDKVVICPEEGIFVTPTVNATQNDYKSTTCKRNIADLYPGDSYVNWIVIHTMNDKIGEWETSGDLIHKGMFAASLASNTKPIMVIIGSRSDDVYSKSSFITEMQKWTSYYSDTNPWWNQKIAGIMMNNREGNFDTAFYNSLKGDIVTSKSNNGIELFSYKKLQTVFKTDVNSITNADFEAALIGALCSPGNEGDLNAGVCRPCPAGHYQQSSGKDSCDMCPLNFYNEDVGQILCMQCPFDGITLHPGAARKDYCECPANWFSIDDEDDECKPCPRNQYSHPAGLCVDCPKDAQFSGSKGGPGVGCFCKKGFEWKGRECVTKDSSAGMLFFVGIIALTAAIVI